MICAGAVAAISALCVAISGAARLRQLLAGVETACVGVVALYPSFSVIVTLDDMVIVV